MIINRNDKKVIRKLETKDINKVLDIYDANDFDYEEIAIEPKPSTNEMKRVISNIVNEKILTAQILVLEKENNIIGYALIEKTYPDTYYLSQLVISECERNKGYGKYLLDAIKELAKIDNSNIELDTLDRTGTFFEKQGFIRNGYCYSYDCQNIQTSIEDALFYSKEEIKEKNKLEVERQIEKNKVFLKKLKNI